MNTKFEEIEPIQTISEAKIINIPIGNKAKSSDKFHIETPYVIPLAVFDLPLGSNYNEDEVYNIGMATYNEGYNDGVKDFVECMKVGGYPEMAEMFLGILKRKLNQTK